MPRCILGDADPAAHGFCSPSRTGGHLGQGEPHRAENPDHKVKAVKGKKEEGSFVIMSIRAVSNPDVMKYLDAG
jgi:hypothetical protein